MQELNLDDIYDVWYTSFWQTLPGYVILIILCMTIVIGVYLIVRLVNHYRIGTSKDKALRHLRELSKQITNKKVEVDKGYQMLTDVTKRYVQWRYSMPQGMTDYELIAWLEDADTSYGHKQNIERIIIDAQVIKFGRVVASKKHVLNDIETVASFIEYAGDRANN